jgi:hypothetical protein
MDTKLFGSKHLDIYFNTMEFGIGINYVPQHKTLYLRLIVLEFSLCFLKE